MVFGNGSESYDFDCDRLQIQLHLWILELNLGKITFDEFIKKLKILFVFQDDKIEIIRELISENKKNMDSFNSQENGFSISYKKKQWDKCLKDVNIKVYNQLTTNGK